MNSEDSQLTIIALDKLAQEHKVPLSDERQTVISALDKAAAKRAREVALDPTQFDSIYTLFAHYKYVFGDPATITRKQFGFAYAGMSNALWHVKQGAPLPYDGTNRVKFNMALGERPVHCMGSTILSEERTVSNRHYSGVSVPLGGGLRYNAGAIGSNSVTGLMPLDEGDFLMTDRSIYFGGKRLTLCLPYRTVLRIEPYIDGVGVFQSHGAQKVFVQGLHGGESGWFLVEMLTTLMEQDKK
jgi:hypothetical protein